MNFFAEVRSQIATLFNDNGKGRALNKMEMSIQERSFSYAEGEKNISTNIYTGDKDIPDLLPLSSSTNRYNLNTPFLVDCLRHGWYVPLQPLEGELDFNVEEGDRVLGDMNRSRLFCIMFMVLPANMSFILRWNNYKNLNFEMYETEPSNKIFTTDSLYAEWNKEIITSGGNHTWMMLTVFNATAEQAYALNFNFTVVPKSSVVAVEKVFTSATAELQFLYILDFVVMFGAIVIFAVFYLWQWRGYLQSRGFYVHMEHTKRNTVSLTAVRVPPGMVVMINVPYLHTGSSVMCTAGKLSIHTSPRIESVHTIICSDLQLDPFILHMPAFYVRFEKTPPSGALVKGFKLRFSFHKEWDRLQKVSKYQWNCSVAHWDDYSEHFPCNLDSNCVDSIDEVNCPYTSPRCRPGQFLAANRCYIHFPVDDNELRTWNKASAKCRQEAGRLVSFDSLEEWDAVLDTVAKYKTTFLFPVGLRTTMESMPQIYGRALQLSDSNIAYYFKLGALHYPKPFCCCVFLRMSSKLLIAVGCNEKMAAKVVCELGPAADDTTIPAAKKQPRGVLDVSSMFTLHEGSAFNSTHFVTCPDGHLTHVFLACDAQSACWTQRGTICSAPMTPLPPSFLCSDGLQHVPYTLVCDFRPDCIDNSDENFCYHLPCLMTVQFECQNAQCVGIEKLCDEIRDCFDGSDEIYCLAKEMNTTQTSVTGPAYVNFSRNGLPVLVPLNNDSQHLHTPSHTHLCPDQYFACDSSPLCFPVYTRCNDVYDCPGREDETGCDGSYKCPGLLRCRGSKVCVAPSELCDGIYHCPQHDDEVTCAYSCPETCTCHGLAFFCRGLVLSFQFEEFQHLRFLDASGSELQPSAVANNIMLIHVRLAHCGVTELKLLDMPNLHILDLSENLLTDISDQHLSKLPYLRHLILAGNPLISIFAQKDRKSPPILSGRMRHLDLSRVIMTQLVMADLSIFPNLQALNISNCRADILEGSGLQAPPALRVLDMRGCPMTHFQADFFQSLSELEELSADNYKLCCPQVLPPDFNLAHCKAPSDEVSSCENLLRSSVYRVFLALFVSLTFSGNIVVFVCRVILATARNGFDIFTTTLCVSDFLMGIYLAIIGVADRIYLGSYLWNDVTWRHSFACSLAGFLSIVSNEVSALVICLITLDRFLVLRFPFSNIRFNRTSGIVVSGFVWVVGMVLAAIPLLPATAHWQFYAVNGMCLPLPITRKDFPGQYYSFSLIIVFNFVLFLLIAVGQLLIYLSVQKNSIRTGSSTAKSNRRDLALARRLILIAVTDFMCWFPVGLLGIMASNGVSISGELNVAMATFVLPINSAINPFLYTVNRMLETRRVEREKRLMNQLLAQAKQQAAMDHT